jgi:hypothetical protein
VVAAAGVAIINALIIARVKIVAAAVMTYLLFFLLRLCFISQCQARILSIKEFPSIENSSCITQHLKEKKEKGMNELMVS